MADVAVQHKMNRKASSQRRRNRMKLIIKFIKAQQAPFRQVDIARACGLHHEIVRRLLPDLDKRGILLCEDIETGMLFPLPEWNPDTDY